MLDCCVAGNLQVGPEELFLSGHAEELSDHADGPAALHRRRRPALRSLLSRPTHRKNIANPDKVVRLNRIHLEEDVAKSTHLGNSSLIDFNRAGTPLMEIVTEPDLESAEEAFAYLRSLQMILQQGGVSDADMEKGQLRCDVNISLRKNAADPLGPKVELKNLNSISAIRRAIHFEIQRQTEDLDRGIPQIQSTRRWDDDRGETQLMRTKEDAHDYRYFSCPDLLPIQHRAVVGKSPPARPRTAARTRRALRKRLRRHRLRRLRALLGQTPRRLFRSRHSTPPSPARRSPTSSSTTCWAHSTSARSASTTARSPRKNSAPCSCWWKTAPSPPTRPRKSSPCSIDSPDKDPAAIADSLGFKPAEAGELEALVDQAIANNPAEVEAVKAGNEKLLNFLTGQVMKAAATKPNPKQVTELLRARLL